MMGVTPGDAARLMTDAGADIVGSNCGTGLLMEDYAGIVAQFRAATAAPVLVRPNAGAPQLIGEAWFTARSRPTWRRRSAHSCGAAPTSSGAAAARPRSTSARSPGCCRTNNGDRHLNLVTPQVDPHQV